jgi:protoheme IX farnesyltransferase
MAFAAVPGAIPGALPVAMGFISASGDWLAPGAWYLFLILFIWQMPHFWALALRYREDYSQGGFPTLPVALGEPKTLYNIRIWLLAYVGVWLLLPLFFHVHSVMLVIILLGSVFLVWTLRRYERQPHTLRWLEFFLAVNFSLILFLIILGIDLWSSVFFQHWIRA